MTGYRELAPAGPLRSFVECYWLADERGGGTRDVLPDGCVDLLIDRTTGAGWLVGAMTRPHRFAPAAPIEFAAVRFRPGGAHAFVRDDLHQFTDARAPLAAFPGLREVAERVASAPGAAAAIAELERALLARLPRRPDDAVSAALERLCGVPASRGVAELARSVGITRQHLAREVRRRTGLSPRQLAGILRFRACMLDLGMLDLGMLDLGGRGSLAAIAAAHGYADQAHMTRAVTALAGEPPARWRAARALR